MGKKRKGCFGCFPLIGLLFLGISAVVIYYAYTAVLKDNIAVNETKVDFLIPEDATFKQVVDSLTENNIIINEATFRQVAYLKKYPDMIKPGKYEIQNTWNNNELINHLRSGNQLPVKFVINNARTREDLAGIVSRQLEIDSLDFLQSINNNKYYEKFGFTKDNFPSMFLANTYELYWNTDVESFMTRMDKEYKRFWTDERLKKAEKLNLTPEEVITLASIVEEETKVADELPVVAGLYLNRLKNGIPLQADPTVKFAVGDFTLRRILNKHLTVDSPYNTYLYGGLPPGPIRIPELNAVKAVLEPKTHEYIYMCAKSDFSGRHAFAKTLAQHNQNAADYHNALNKEGIK